MQWDEDIPTSDNKIIEMATLGNPPPDNYEIPINSTVPVTVTTFYTDQENSNDDSSIQNQDSVRFV